MVFDDTKMGGKQEQFPPTRFSAIAALESADMQQKQLAWAALISAYWKPVYKYLRIRWQLSNENAKDTTQSFFASAMEKSFFQGFSPEKARFRTFLRVCLDRFLANQKKAAGREKRGGTFKHLALDFENAEGEVRQLSLSDKRSAEDFFEQEWIRSLFEISIENLRDQCKTNGKEVHFALFNAYDLHVDSDQPRPSYQQLAERHQLPVTQVTNYLAAARKQFRQIVLNHLREITASDSEFREEARVVLGVDLST